MPTKEELLEFHILRFDQVMTVLGIPPDSPAYASESISYRTRLDAAEEYGTINPRQLYPGARKLYKTSEIRELFDL